MDFEFDQLRNVGQSAIHRTQWVAATNQQVVQPQRRKSLNTQTRATLLRHKVVSDSIHYSRDFQIPRIHRESKPKGNATLVLNIFVL